MARLLVALLSQGRFGSVHGSNSFQRASIPVYGNETLIESDTSACGRYSERRPVTFIQQYDKDGSPTREFKVLGEFNEVSAAIDKAVAENSNVEVANTGASAPAGDAPSDFETAEV